MPEKETNLLSFDVWSVLVDQFYDLDKLATENQRYSSYLPFASLDAFRVEVPLLEMCKTCFGGGGLIRVRGTQNDLNPEVTNAFSRCCTSMVRGSVHEKHDFISPIIWELLGKNLTKSRQKHHHHVFIGIALSQWQPNVALWGYCRDHVYAVPHDSFYHRVFCTLRCPSPFSEIGFRYPCLIDVDNVLSLAVNLEHLLSVKRA